MACSPGCERSFYCDSGTNRCETCRSICDPLRLTGYACCRQSECKEFWYQTETSGGNGRWDGFINDDDVIDWRLILTFISLLAVIVLLLVLLIWTRRNEFRRERIYDCLRREPRTPIRQETEYPPMIADHSFTT